MGWGEDIRKFLGEHPAENHADGGPIQPDVYISPQRQLPQPLVTQTELTRLHNIESTVKVLIDLSQDEQGVWYMPPTRLLERLKMLTPRPKPP